MLILALTAMLGATPEPLSFEALVKETSASHTPIVMDLYTTWCRPCLEMENTVFHDPSVLEVLSKARFVRYDAERGPGIAVAEALGVYGYPTVILLTPEGTEIARPQSHDPGPFLEELKPLLALATVKGPFTEEAAGAKDADARVIYIAALKLKSSNPAKAATLFEQAAARDESASLGVRGIAVEQAARLRYVAAIVPAKLRALESLANGDPENDTTVAALGTLSRFPGFDAAAARALGERVRAQLVKSKNGAQLNALIYSQLALHDLEGALSSAKVLEALNPSPFELDSVAEAYFQAGQKEKAIEVEEAALKRAPDRSALRENLQRFKTQAPTLPVFEGPNPLTAFDSPPPVDPEMTEKRLLGAAIADACRSVAGRTHGAHLRVSFTAEKITKSLAYDLETPAALRQCVEKKSKGKTSKILSGYTDVELDVPFSAQL